jgi:soluble lytic murein transglycosylase
VAGMHQPSAVRHTLTVGAAVLAFGWFAPAAAVDRDGAFLSARDAFQKGQIGRLDELAGHLVDYPLYPYIAAWQLRSRLAESAPDEVQRFLAQQGDSLAGQRLLGDWLKRLGNERSWDLFERHYPAFALEDQEVACYALQARLARGDLTSLQEARPLWFQGAAQAESCGPLFDALVIRGQVTEEDVWVRVRLALEAGNVGFVKQLMAYLPPAKRISSKQLDAVARNPQRYLERFPLPLRTQGERELAMFATWRVAQRLPAVAATRLNKYEGLLPAADRSYVWAQVATAGALQHRPEALEWFNRAGDEQLSDRQLGWKARTGLRAGDWRTVLEAIDAMSEREAQLTPWRYWKARALLALGNTAGANAILAPLSAEHSYYGQLAHEELGPGMAAIPTAYRPADDQVEAVDSTPGIQRAIKFFQLGLRYEGALEWGWTTRSYDDYQLLAAAEVARRNGWYERAIHTAERTSTLHDFALRFPTPYRDVVSSYARALDLEEAWVYGLVRQESRFVVDARSSAGAQGLMQLMPSTARQVARRLGLPGFERHHVISVDTNINLGTYYLRQLLDDLDNQAVLASAGYNAGMRRARAWRAERPLEGAVYVESIPFTETRDYVRKVMSNTMYYSRLFGQPFVTLKQRLGTIGPRPSANE